MDNSNEIINTILIKSNSERVQLIRALTQRKEYLASIDARTWDSAPDSQGSLDECKASTIRLLQQARRIKL